MQSVLHICARLCSCVCLWCLILVCERDTVQCKTRSTWKHVILAVAGPKQKSRLLVICDYPGLYVCVCMFCRRFLAKVAGPAWELVKKAIFVFFPPKLFQIPSTVLLMIPAPADIGFQGFVERHMMFNTFTIRPIALILTLTLSRPHLVII